MQWTDRIRQVKIVLVVAAVFIAVASLFISNYLVRDLSAEERTKMEVWAEAMRSFNMADENTDLNLVLKVMDENHTIPVIVLDSAGQVTTFRNLKIKGDSEADSMAYVTAKGHRQQAEGMYVRIYLGDGAEQEGDYIDVCYDDSVMIKRLQAWPFVQLGVVMVFVVEVWVGLSKETAHQLGTPISSLMAWTEILKETYPDDDLLPEMDKDVQRLQLIADRFSKIGSMPELTGTSLNTVMDHVADYMRRRTSAKVNMIKQLPTDDVIVKANAALFEWVIENLCKNAVDAMEGAGTITLHVEKSGNKALIDVTDTGKGIRKKDQRNVFTPGFTTKKRGWGLGLSLAKRIVEEYHRGRIYVKNSELGKGTTFRIELRCDEE